MDKYRFGNYLTKLRIERGLSQSELGAQVGVTNKAISKWENGEAFPRLERLQALADFFGVTAEELINGGAVQPNSPSELSAPQPDFGKLDGESSVEKANEYAAYLEREEKRAVRGRRWTIAILVAEPLVVWLPMIPLILISFSSPFWKIVFQEVVGGYILETLLELLISYLIGRGYSWARWGRIINNLLFVISNILSGSFTFEQTGPMWYETMDICAFILYNLFILTSACLLAFYRPIKDFLAEQRHN